MKYLFWNIKLNTRKRHYKNKFENYCSFQFTKYDIALIKLKKPLKLNAKIAKVNLPKKGEKPKGNVTVAGWGATSSDQFRPEPAEILQAVDLKIIDNHLCELAIDKKFHEWISESIGLTEEQKEKMLKLKYLLSRTSFCASGPLGGGKGTCYVSLI